MDQPLSSSQLSKQSNKAKLKVIIGLFGITIVLFSIHWLLTPSAKLSSLRTAKIEIADIASTISAGGIIIPANESTLSSETNSQIVDVYAQAGQKVIKGMHLLQLETRALKLSIETINENILLKDTQIKTKGFMVNKTIHEIESRDQILTVELELRTVKAGRLRQLSLTGAAAKHDLLEAEILVKRTKIELKQLKQSIIDHQSTSNAEIEGLLLEKTILNKSLLEKQRLLANSLVVANRDGILTWIKKEQGASVTLGEPLAKISDANQFRVEATLSDFYAPQLTHGMEVIVSYNEHKLEGYLETLSPTIENGIMKLIVNLKQPENKLLHQNIRVDVGLITDRAEKAKTIIKGAFVKGQGTQTIFVIRNGVAYRTKVDIGFSDKDRYQIIGDIKQGDEIIISDTSHFAHLKEFIVN
ncbi:MAG: hypothetical protein COA86_11470 [Kangiella sp.]|nr:MAG: hypothetical protein COA86_11470 [Kangiella sp.]